MRGSRLAFLSAQSPVDEYADAVVEKLMTDQRPNALLELTAEIVSAYVAGHTIDRSELVGLIDDVHGALMRLNGHGPVEAREEQKPAVAIKKSITPDYLICLEDGKKFKSLKRHLRSHYNLTPEAYRDKWGLPHDYPMVAPRYAEARSQLAKKMGLGTRRER